MEIEIVHRAVCQHYNIPLNTLFEKTRRRHIAEMRQVFFYVCRRMTKYSSIAIGEYPRKVYGKFWNHATVLHGIKAIDNLLIYNKLIKYDVSEIKKMAEHIEKTYVTEFPKLKEELAIAVIHAETYNTLLERVENIIMTHKARGKDVKVSDL